MFKNFVAIAIVSTFIICGLAFAQEQDINAQLTKLTEQSATMQGISFTDQIKEPGELQPEEQNPVTEELLNRDIIQQGEAQRLNNQQ